MIVLGIESSTPAASAALVSGEGLLGEITLNTGLTHSEQLLPIIDDLLRETKYTTAQLQGIAVSGGPGSFTGLRIGMATAKGLAQGRDLPLVSVPTLKALAFRHAASECLVSPVMNARRSEVYAALYRMNRESFEELVPALAVEPRVWAEKLAAYGERVVFIGDGVMPYLEVWQQILGAMFSAPPLFVLGAHASGIAWLGRERLLQGEKDDLFSLTPFYIRPAEAQVKIQSK